MIFREQIEKRREQERRALWEAYENLAGVVKPGKESLRGNLQEDDVYKVILASLEITDAELNPEEGDLQEQFEGILRQHDVMFRKIVLEGYWWKHTTGSILAHLSTGRLIALRPGRWRGYYYTDPDTGRKVWLDKKESRKIEQDAYCFYPPFPSRKLTAKDVLRFIGKQLGMADWLYVVLACLVVSLLGMLTPYMNKQIFNNIIPSGDTGDILPVAGLLIGASLGSVLFNITRSLVLARLKDKVDVTAQAAIMGRTYNLPVNFFRNYSSGDLSNRIMGFSRMCGLLSDQVVSSLLTLLFSVIYVYQIFIYAETLLVPSLCILLVTLALIFLNYWVETRYRRQLLEKTSRLTGLVFSLFSGIQKIKLAGAEVRIFKKWTDYYKESAYLEANPPLFLRLNAALSGACSLGGTALLYYFAFKKQVNVSDYIAFSSAFGLVNGALVSLFALIPLLAQVKPLYKLLSPILEVEPEMNTESVQVPYLSGNIDIMNLSFRYNPDGPFVINDLSLSIKAGEYVAIVGTSGCGKSTLLRLLLGFETPEQGAIVYDQYDLSKVDKQSLRRRIGTCLQNGKLFPGDIFSNITVTAPWSTREEAWEAARMAGCAEEIREMPMNMFTMISEAGGGISGGQRQRILIARALINKPAILLFDEATSALDNVKQQIVTENLDRLGCTRIVIAHRLSTIRHCDRIIVLDKGKIAEEGDFQRLMERKGLFYEMSKRQL
ncbi:NHLP bacteriocin export ABC transporter permease/ATPase subunit [Parabacteroides sp.]